MVNIASTVSIEHILQPRCGHLHGVHIFSYGMEKPILSKSSTVMEKLKTCSEKGVSPQNETTHGSENVRLLYSKTLSLLKQYTNM